MSDDLLFGDDDENATSRWGKLLEKHLSPDTNTTNVVIPFTRPEPGIIDETTPIASVGNLKHYEFGNAAGNKALQGVPFAAKLKDSDVIPGEYEGGFKLWNCAGDLVNALSERNINLSGLKVCETGCGHGLPGMYAVQKGAALVCFQDFNSEVLQRLTIPNLLLNFPQEEAQVANRVAFWAGDWLGFVSDQFDVQFDVILGTDVLYNERAIARWFAFVLQHLKKGPESVVYVGSKTFYFGCGGGMEELEQLVAHHNASDPCKLKVDVLCTIQEDAVQRQVLALKWLL
eukprot:TRINITY_DN52021_c0_g1_i1.p1 TRINITY_DN52021_c0_g1~~TRINITY_DN52021_c0_g1_i1.p1  ORF type:complete len:287 (+),score=36.98 TRINITY_DN52021_c0_g1_i1:43-903(+)